MLSPSLIHPVVLLAPAWRILRAPFQPAPTRPLLVLAILLALVFCVALLYTLHRLLGPRGRRWLIALVTFFTGLFYGLEYFLPVSGDPPKNFLTDWIPRVADMVAVIAAFTVGLGIFSLCQVHGRNIARRRVGWLNSVAFYLAMAAMLVFGIWDHYATAAAAQAQAAEEQAPAAPQEPAAPGALYVDGALVPAASVTIADGQPIVPLRPVVERAGGTVHWKPEAREAQARFHDHRLAVIIGSDLADVDGEARRMPLPASLADGRTLIPAASLAGALGMLLEPKGGAIYISGPPPPPPPPPWPEAVYSILFSGLFAPLQAATFSLLAFYIASAAYRAFRVRTAEAGLMMAAAFLVMLGQVPFGAWLTSAIPASSPWAFFRLEVLGDWIMKWLNMPAQRGILFGIAVGALAMSLRVWLSLERGTFFSEKS